MKTRDLSGGDRRQVRNLRQRARDPYQRRQKLPGPARCPQCGAVYRHGRWSWDGADTEAEEALCQACQRTNDRYPAGEVRMTGDFVGTHQEEIRSLARNVERAENAEHPLHRIMSIEDIEGGIRILTTDVHLPHAIGHALKDAFEGDLQTSYDEDEHFARTEWSRDA